MRIRIAVVYAVLIASVAIVPIACQEQQPEQPPAKEQREQPSPLRTGWQGGGSFVLGNISFGGDPPVGPFEVRHHTWDDGQRWLSLGLAQFPGRALGPVFLIIGRIPPGEEPESCFVNQGRKVFTIQSEMDSKAPGRALAEWALIDKGLQQTMNIAGTEYNLRNGRVFLVDAAAKAVSVHQIAADLGGTFDAPGPDFDKLADEIEALRKNDVKVKRFWSGSHPDIEEN